MGRRKKTDEKNAKPIRGPGRKSRKQGEPTFPKELLPPGEIHLFVSSSDKNIIILESSEKKKVSSRGKQRFVHIDSFIWVIRVF